MDARDPFISSEQTIVTGSFDTKPAGIFNRLRGNKRRIFWWLGAGGVLLIVALVTAVILITRHGQDTSISKSVANVTVDASGITPTTIKVTKNQQLTWTNNDTRPHRLTADQKALPGMDSTEELNKGDSYTYVFEHAGTYHYYDPADPNAYTGTVVVE